jgi:hypothetical protein
MLTGNLPACKKIFTVAIASNPKTFNKIIASKSFLFQQIKGYLCKNSHYAMGRI